MDTRTKTLAQKLKRVKESSYWTVKDLSISLAGLVLIGLTVATVISSENLSRNDRLLPHLKIAGVPVGNLTKQQAADKLEKATADFRKQGFTFTYDKNDQTKTFKAHPDDWGLSLDLESSLNRAGRLGHSNNFFSDLKAQLVTSYQDHNLPLLYSVNPLAQKAFLDTAFLEIEKPALQATLRYEGEELKKLKGTAGQEVDRAELTRTLLEQTKTLTLQSIPLKLEPVNPQITINDLQLEEKLVQQVLNSNFKFTYDQKSFVLSKDILASWMEFYSILPENVLGKAICDCGLPQTVSTKSDRAQSVPSLLVTPFDQKRLGVPATDPYFVMLPPQNFTEQPFETGQLLPVFGFNRDKVNHWLIENISQQIDRPGVNARLSFTNGKLVVTRPSANGIKVNIEKATRDIVLNIADPQATPSTKLVLAEAKPEINEQMIDKLGIKTLIGRGVSDFSGSPPNRIHNINVGFEKYSGLVIPPHKEFSVIKKLGPVDAAAGFLPELVIVGKKITPQYGGGLCQVSTTIFRAALDAGLAITDRTNHSFAVSYYKWPYPEWGVEATIYDPAPDLKFRNDTDHYILIQAYTTPDGKAYVDFYGTDPGRSTTIEGPWRLSGSMAGGGTTTFNYIVRDAKGVVMRKQKFVSIFQPFKNFKHE